MSLGLVIEIEFNKSNLEYQILSIKLGGWGEGKEDFLLRLRDHEKYSIIHGKPASNYSVTIRHDDGFVLHNDS